MTQENLITDTLDIAREYTVKLNLGIDKFANHIDNNENQEALALLPLIVEGMEWLLKAASLTASSQKYELNISKLNNYLSEINEALENQDYILLRDILKYEISQHLRDWYVNNFGN